MSAAHASAGRRAARRGADHCRADGRARHDARGRTSASAASSTSAAPARCSRSTRRYEVALGAEAWAADFLQQGPAGLADRPPRRNLGPPAAAAADRRRRHGRGPARGPAGPLQPEQPRSTRTARTNPEAVKQLERILAMLEIEPAWAVAIADWIDQDIQPGFPDGAEDSVYTGQDPPHLDGQHAGDARQRAAGAAAVRRGTLPRAEAVSSRRCRSARKLNVCTAPGIVLDCAQRGQPRVQPQSRRPRQASQGRAASRRSRTCAARSATRPTTRSRTRSQNRAITSAPPCGSLLAPPSSPCTVCSLAAAPARCGPALRSFGSE